MDVRAVVGWIAFCAVASAARADGTQGGGTSGGGVNAPAVASSAVAARPRVLVLDTKVGPGAEAEAALAELLAHVLEQHSGAEIVVASSVRQRLALVSQKAELGCDDQSCMSELAGALDARYVVSSHATRLGSRWLARVELFDAESLRAVAQGSVTGESVDDISAQAEGLIDQLLGQAPFLRRNADPSAGAGGVGARAVAPQPVGAEPVAGQPANPFLIGGGVATGIVGLGAGLLGGLYYVYAQKAAGIADSAEAAYFDNPTADTRRAYAVAAKEASDAGYAGSVCMGPLACAALPLLGAAAGLVWFGLPSAPANNAAAGESP